MDLTDKLLSAIYFVPIDARAKRNFKLTNFWF